MSDQLKNWFVPTVIAALLYFPGSFLPHQLILIPLGYLFVHWLGSVRFDLGDDLLLLFVGSAFVVVGLSFSKGTSGDQLQPLFLPLMILCALAAKNIEKKILYCILAFVVIEIFWTVVQSVPRLHLGRALYDSRPEGFGGAGRVGERVFLGIAIGWFLKEEIPDRVKWAIYAILFGGAFLNFTRSVFIAALPLLSVVAFDKMRRFKSSPVFWIIIGLLFMVPFLIRENLFQLFFREKTFEWGLVLSGRDKLWEAAWLNYLESPLLGLEGQRWGSTVYSVVGAAPNNSHNSYLDVLTSFGALSWLLFVSVLIRVHSKNAALMASILLFSLFNKSLFWNVSLFDLLMYHFAFHSLPNSAIQVSTIKK